jgi:hypothetical protein
MLKGKVHTHIMLIIQCDNFPHRQLVEAFCVMRVQDCKWEFFVWRVQLNLSCLVQLVCICRMGGVILNVCYAGAEWGSPQCERHQCSERRVFRTTTGINRHGLWSHGKAFWCLFQSGPLLVKNIVFHIVMQLCLIRNLERAD